ncbi:hypothetical protein MN116_008465 [Schistosoma mekongi]|uniref:Uncharacterized protein n=2 Tax=Schistosoma TaxID=6181 RepID=A0AAE2D1H3_SCHME|nr:hypothetical protein MN116_008465 [Schistosoma mekongi]
MKWIDYVISLLIIHLIYINSKITNEMINNDGEMNIEDEIMTDDIHKNFINSSEVSIPLITTIMTDEQRLLSKILNGYDTASRPIFNASKSVQVGFQFTLIQISQLDEVNQVLTLNVWIEQEWIDERLTWNPQDYNNLSRIRIPCQKLWLPDIVLYNSADDYKTDYMQSKAMVQSNGNVFWPPPAKLRSTCKIDITYFPFDDQSCTMKFGSWTYDGWQVNIIKRHDEVDTSNYIENGEWDLLKIVVERHEIFYPCCEEPYPDLRFTIYMRRRTLYYLFNIIFPCLWLTVLSLVSFWLPPDSGEKITLGITVLLAFSVFMLLIAENMPATSEFVPLIGVYLTVTMTMTSLSIILTVLVLHLHHTSSNRQPIPKYLRKFFFDIIAKFFCLNIVQRYQIKRNQTLKLTKQLKLITNQLHNDYYINSSHSNNAHDTNDHDEYKKKHHNTILQSDYLPLNIVNSMNAIGEEQELSTTTMATSTTTATKYTETSTYTQQIKQPSLINSKQYEAIETLNYPHQHHLNQLNNVTNEKTINSPQTIHILLNTDYVTSNIEKQNKKIYKAENQNKQTIKKCNHYEMLYDYETIAMIQSNNHLSHDDETNDSDHPDDDVISSSASMFHQQVYNKANKLQFLQNKQQQCQIMKDLLKILEKSKKQQNFLQSYLYYLYMKQSDEQQILDMINEWRILAIIVDRMLFWLFLTNAVIATIVILIIMPLFKPTLV